MSKKFLTPTAAALVALTAGALPLSASAAIMYTSWQQDDTGGLQGTTGATTTMTFDQYNSANYGDAALHNVEIELASNGYATYQFSDLSGAENTFTFQANETVKVTGDGGTLIIVLPSLIDDTRTVDALGSYTSPGYPADFQSGITASDSTAETYVGASLTPAIAALFTGTGTVDLLSSATIANNTTSSGDNSTTLLSRYDAVVRVRYSYEVTEAPEPATMLLFGAGMIGVGAVARRRKKAA